MKLATLERIRVLRAASVPAVLVTDLGSGAQAIATRDGVEGDLSLDEATASLALARLKSDRSGRLDAPHDNLFVQCHNPPLRMIIVGAVHIGQALAPMAATAGYAVTVIDPRRSFATAERFPGVELNDEWPDDALEALKPDSRTAIITLTHDPKLDDPALHAALRSDAFYIGCLGSTRTHAKRLERLREAGFGDADFTRIHGPLGLNIGAKSPAEIAVSALAQVVEVLRNGPKAA
jgi:xanthine dehydrogenase accessory factor